LKYRKFKPSD